MMKNALFILEKRRPARNQYYVDSKYWKEIHRVIKGHNLNSLKTECEWKPLLLTFNNFHIYLTHNDFELVVRVNTPFKGSGYGICRSTLDTLREDILKIIPPLRTYKFTGYVEDM